LEGLNSVESDARSHLEGKPPIGDLGDLDMNNLTDLLIKFKGMRIHFNREKKKLEEIINTKPTE